MPLEKRQELPAVRVVQLFDGIHATARALDCHFTTVSGWIHRPPQGQVPQKWHRKIIQEAKKRGHTLPADFFLMPEDRG